MQTRTGYLFLHHHHFMITTTSLLSRKDTIKSEHEMLSLAEALQGFRSYDDLFREAGLTAGRIEFSEDSDEGNLYGLEVNVLEPAPGMDAEKTEEALRGAVDLRELADHVTNSGEGEFFTVEIDFTTFAQDWIEPLVGQLTKAGVTVDV